MSRSAHSSSSASAGSRSSKEARNGPHTGVIAASTEGNVPGSYSLNRADVADYLLRAASDDTLIHQTVAIAQG
ncbi:hypothetical protein AB0N89_06265 [Amycolatopsis sp. NPDC089917]|uniref:hypothetical protein n=1 Tax=Amycolatopsis sp. NPDC089917 TaxID=3155187 RepID=UPI00343B01AC